MTKKKSKNNEICKKCKVEMKVFGHSQRQLDRDELGGDLSDGEESEYIAAELGGDDTGEFTINQTIYKCPKCSDLRIFDSQ